MSESKAVRINKFLSEAGFCSRREADKLIDIGAVKINGKVPEMGTKVQANDVVTVDGKEVKNKQTENIYIAFNTSYYTTTRHIHISITNLKALSCNQLRAPTPPLCVCV